MINNEAFSWLGGDAVAVPDWLTDPADRAKWLTLSDRDRSDWARSHGTAAASSAAAAAAEAGGRIAAEAQQKAQAAAMDIASEAPAAAASYRAPVPWYRTKGFLIAGGVGAGALLLYFAARPKRRPPQFRK